MKIALRVLTIVMFVMSTRSSLPPSTLIKAMPLRRVS